MNLAKLLEGVSVSKLFQTMFGQMAVTQDIMLAGLQYDSRKVHQNDCFVAIKGSSSDGHRFLQTAIANGAKAVVVEDDQAIPDPLCMHTGVIKIVVPDTRRALAQMAANYYGHPSRNMKVAGVTGTNGKTTTTHLLKSIFESAGEKTGLIGTIEYRIGERVVPATHTTPESLELQQFFAEMAKEGCTAVSMEVSSHALHQSRVSGIDFDAAVFSNLTQDHLDYHGTMEKYFEAKKIFFNMLKPDACAVFNADDPYGSRLVESSTARKISYGIEQEADVRAGRVDLSINGTSMEVFYGGGKLTITSPLIGRFNAYNILSAAAAAIGLGISEEKIQEGISRVANVRGRFERIASPKGWTAIVDYAHTPDALENCLRAIHDVLPAENRGAVITVFGAGGDRDKTKRSLMGEVAGRLSDLVIVTSDNPRTEDPETIVDEVLRGITQHASVLREMDRALAIERALSAAHAGDVVLIAGKGHEDYQIIGKEKRHFSDREVIEKFL